MKGIQTQEVHQDQGIESTLREYKVQIDGKWFKIIHTEGRVLDGRFACSSNIHKWDFLGMRHEFKIAPTKAPEVELPDTVQQFIKHYQETGKKKGYFMQEREDANHGDREHPGHKWGWVEKPFKHEYVC